MFGGGGRGPMGGGGGMLRAASRAMTRTGVANGGIGDPFNSSSSSSAGNSSASNISHGGRAGSASRHNQKLGSSSGLNNLTISASGSPLNLPLPANLGWNGGNFAFYEDFEWVSEEGSEDDSVFGSVPSVDEVQEAVSALQQVFDGSSYNGGQNQSHQISSFGSDLDWMEPSMQLCDPRILKPHGYDQVYNAFDLLRTEPSVQRMVISLSSDKAVWEAVMNNDVVREIRDLYNNGITQAADVESSDGSPGESNNAAMDFIKWVFDNTMVKATEVFEKITKVVTQFFITHTDADVDTNNNPHDAKCNTWVDEKLRTSVLLSIVVLLVVMVSRACNRS